MCRRAEALAPGESMVADRLHCSPSSGQIEQTIPLSRPSFPSSSCFAKNSAEEADPQQPVAGPVTVSLVVLLWVLGHISSIKNAV